MDFSFSTTCSPQVLKICFQNPQGHVLLFGSTRFCCFGFSTNQQIPCIIILMLSHVLSIAQESSNKYFGCALVSNKTTNYALRWDCYTKLSYSIVMFQCNKSWVLLWLNWLNGPLLLLVLIMLALYYLAYHGVICKGKILTDSLLLCQLGMSPKLIYKYRWVCPRIQQMLVNQYCPPSRSAH